MPGVFLFGTRYRSSAGSGLLVVMTGRGLVAFSWKKLARDRVWVAHAVPRRTWSDPQPVSLHPVLSDSRLATAETNQKETR
jgi:hypothetical protein